jgi:hypothetical protein
MRRRGVVLSVACVGLIGAGCVAEDGAPRSERIGQGEEGLVGSIASNGSFEVPQLRFDSFDEVHSIPGWTAVAVPAPQPQYCTPTIEQDNHVGSIQPAPEGNQSVELNANCPSGIEQNLATVPGTTYVLKFAFAARLSDPSAAHNRLNVYWNGSPVAATLTSTSAAWAYDSFVVTATGSTTPLAFYSGSVVNTSLGTELDDVGVVPLAPGGGAFVIGDKNAVVGASVTFWGAQWAKDNGLSGGAAPSSFKGLVEAPAALCGSTWSADPGNSTPPPAGPLPHYMVVLVSSSVSKSGHSISGNTVGAVLVQTSPGYGPDPGSAGTGTVTAVLCP